MPKHAMAAATGAGHITDNSRWSFTQAPEKHDVVIDIAGNQTLPGTRAGTGSERAAGGGRRPEQGRWAGPSARPISMAAQAPAVTQTMVFFLAQQNKADLSVLSEPVQAWTITPVIDRTHVLNKATEAICYLEHRHANGKAVSTV